MRNSKDARRIRKRPTKPNALTSYGISLLKSGWLRSMPFGRIELLCESIDSHHALRLACSDYLLFLDHRITQHRTVECGWTSSAAVLTFPPLSHWFRFICDIARR